MTRFAIAIAVALALAVIPAKEVEADGGWVSGNQLARWCREELPSYGRGACMGYVVAVADSMQSTASVGGVELFCLPEQVTRGQLEAVATKYLVDHPEALHYRADQLVALAFRQAFPCRSR